MDDRCQVDAVYTDFAKAFDKISYNTLLLKLWDLGIHGDLFRWIKSYIENRFQAVVLGGFSSDFKQTVSGVPQGSHLGPLLFILYINDITDCLSNSKALLYADDTKIFKVIKTYADCTLLQNDLLSFETYCARNNLFLNNDKCSVITFTRKTEPILYPYNLCGVILARQDNMRDLGVTMDTKFTFIPHIDNVLNRAYKQLGFILRVAKPFRRPLTYKLLYNSYVRSRLEFASVVWNPCYDVHKGRIERLQKKFIKALEYRVGGNYVDYASSAARHNFQTLSFRRSSADLCFLFKIINNLIDAPDMLCNIGFRVPRRTERSCRSKSLFSIAKSRTKHAQNSYIKRACKLFNEKCMNADLFGSSLATFKKQVYSLIK
jgi:hypothetical protein